MLYKDLIFIGLFIIILSILIFAIYYIKKQFDYYDNKILEINNNIFKIVSLPNQQLETTNDIPLINNDNLKIEENKNDSVNIDSLKQEDKIINISQNQDTKDLINPENSLNQTDILESKEINNKNKIENNNKSSFSCSRSEAIGGDNTAAVSSKESENNKSSSLDEKEVNNENQNIENDIMENQNILMSFLNNVFSNIENQIDIRETPKTEDTEINKVFIIDENIDSNSQTSTTTISENLNISYSSISENKEITDENLKLNNEDKDENINSQSKESENNNNSLFVSSEESEKNDNLSFPISKDNEKDSESDEMIKLLNNDHRELKNKYKNILNQDLKNIKLQELKNIAKFLNIPLTKQLNKYRKEELYNMCLNQIKDQ